MVITTIKLMVDSNSLIRTSMLWLVGLALLTVPAPAKAVSLIGVSFDGTVTNINSDTGRGVAVGSSGFNTLNSLARNSSGTFFSATNFIGADPFLVAINPNTGLGTKVATLDFVRAGDVRGLAFSPSDTLFAINSSVKESGEELPDSLLTIDVDTGTGTLIGNTGLPGIQALAFSPKGALYGWEVGALGNGVGLGLVTIDPLTGLATDVNPSMDGSADDIQGLAFASDGTLYGARESLFSVDVTSGTITLVGSGGYSDVRGIEPVPEPSSVLGVLAFGAISAGSLLKRKQKK